MNNSNRPGQHCIRRQLLPALLFLVAIPTWVRSVYADGGSVLFQRTDSTVSVTVFASQTPVPVGPADLSILIETPGNPDPILDAQVFIELENQAGTKLTTEATHSRARNKLLYCGMINIPEAGHWMIRITVNHNGQSIAMADHLLVAQPQTKLVAYGKLLAFPPVIVILFIVNQWLRRKRHLLAA